MFKNPERVLIVGPSWVGDMVMAQVLFKLLKHHNPQLTLDVLAPNWSRPLLERMPEVHRAWPMAIGHGELQLAQRYRIAKGLREQHYQQAIILPNSFKSALIPWFAKIAKRTGWRGEMRYGLVNDMRVLDEQQLPLMIERFAALAFPVTSPVPKELPKPQLTVNKDAIEQALQALQISHDAQQPILALCPGAEFGPAKRWPPQHYAQVAQEKLKQGWQVWIFGSAKDSTEATEIQKLTSHRCVDLTGKTSLAQAIDLMSLATAVITNDSGLMHIAAALARPLVVMYGSSSPMFTPPLAEQVDILTLNLSCSPCFKRECPLGHLKCLQDLPPTQVLTALDKLLATS